MVTTRPVLDLDGTWNLEILDRNSQVELTAAVHVPGPWTTQVAGYGDSHAAVRYSRTFEYVLGSSHSESVIVAVFGGVNHSARVLLNGQIVGEHEGAWESFECDLTDALVGGENTIVVEVGYPPRYGTPKVPGFLEIPHGKQTWYGTTAGIWQSVRIEERHPVHVTSLGLHADAATGLISVEPQLSRAEEGVQVRVEVSYLGQPVASAVAEPGSPIHVGVDQPELWGIDQPNLYDVNVSVVRDGVICDSVQRTTGFRAFESRDGKFFLNGHELELRGVLDQDYHPGSSSIPESTEALESLFRETRALGFNMLRVHIKRPDPRYYELADRLGMLVWTELPSWLTWTPEGAERGVALLERFIREDEHHPSIVMWTVMNESWGIDLDSSKQREWLRHSFDRVKNAARGSLVVDNSACLPNYHLKTDVDDYHLYRGIPESRREWDRLVSEFAERPSWTFSPHGDGERTGHEPLVLSEFGNWGLPHVLDQFTDGSEPWWFATGADWAFGAAEGTNLLSRFEFSGLREVFGSWESLVRQLQHVQMVANRYQTTSIRSHPELSGYVLTQLSDVQWEANGLFDMNRGPKQFNGEFALVNSDYAVAVRPASYSGFVEQELEVSLTVVPARNGAPQSEALGLLSLSVDGRAVHEVRVPAQSFSTHEFTVTLPVHAGAIELAAELRVDGELVSRDVSDIIVVASAGGSISTPVIAANDDVADWLNALGQKHERLGTQKTSCDGEGSGLLVTTLFDVEAQEHARSGGSVLVLIEDEGALADGFGFLPSARVGARTGDGDWVPRNEWLDRSGPFASVPGETILGIAFEDLLGPLVINGLPNMMRPALQYSGIFSGWLRGTATTTATVRWSEGDVTLTTFQLRQALAQAPVARELGFAMLRAAAGE